MATTEEKSKSASHPPYPEMILAAITALGKNGSNKSSISKHIETTHGENLPGNHSAALSKALEKMKDSGELLLVSDNYLRPDSDEPAPTPRRGRGRPPKAKTSPQLTSPRPRGRPPKPKDPLAAAIAKASGGYPRSRGRPPKNHRPAVAVAIVPMAAAAGGGSVPAVVGVKRGRGRPPKVRPPTADVAAQ